jgi:D-cysteine desulfhydrase/L-cysteate sulfo-lyase
MGEGTAPFGRLDSMPRVRMAHLPTPLEPAANLGADLGIDLWIKRDDCTGIGMGGNKVRQLEFYLGQAVAEGADSVVITGAVQSNFVRTAAAMAARLGMAAHLQLEDRTPHRTPLYLESGNVLLDRLLGATLYHFPEGENEAGADARLEEIADEIRAKGGRPYVIHLGPGHPPLGALGYVDMARELLDQVAATGLSVDRIFVASGSAATHAGLLYGLRASGSAIPVQGICVRRGADLQAPRVLARCREIAGLLDGPDAVRQGDVLVDDSMLAPGYGRLNPASHEAIHRAASREGQFLDPTYTAKVMAGLIGAAGNDAVRGETWLFIHTGGQPALFAYGDQLAGDSEPAG